MYKKSVARDTLEAEESCHLYHDLRNDLAIIMGCCDLLGDSITLDNQQAQKHVDLIRQAARRMRDKILKNPCAASAFERSFTA